jgi:hypothetical protein
MVTTPPSSSTSFLSAALLSPPDQNPHSSAKNKPLQTMLSTGVLGLEKTPAKTQEAVVVNHLLYKEPSWQTLPSIKAGFLWGGLLGAVLHPFIGLIGSNMKRQFIQTGQAWRREAKKNATNALATTGGVFVWLGKNTPYVDTRNLKSWGATALKGGFFGGLMGIGLAWGAIAQIKQGLLSLEADAQGNTNLLKTATWQHKVNNALNQVASIPIEQSTASTIEQEQAGYHAWRKKAFSRTHTFNAMLASGLLYSLVTLGLNALGSKLLFNGLTKTNWPWHLWFERLEKGVNHVYQIGEKRPALKKLHPLVNGLSGSKNGTFRFKTIIANTNLNFSRWLNNAFRNNSATATEANPTPRLLKFLEKSQSGFFMNLASARYHPVVLLQLFITASIGSVLMTVQNKRMIKQLELTVQNQCPSLPSQLNLLSEEDKQRITRLKALKKSVSDAHFSNTLLN